MTKCAFCFTDAGDQTCNKCGDSACNNHRDNKGVCPQNHFPHSDEVPKSEPTSPRVRVTKKATKDEDS